MSDVLLLKPWSVKIWDIKTKIRLSDVSEHVFRAGTIGGTGNGSDDGNDGIR